MGIASFYWNALGLVFDGSLERAEGILFLATLGISFLTEMLPAFKVRGRNVIPRSVHTWRIEERPHLADNGFDTWIDYRSGIDTCSLSALGI
jgi:hypothetical protein